jgi:signal peptidase
LGLRTSKKIDLHALREKNSMSRVERNKDQYAKEDRAVVESRRSAAGGGAERNVYRDTAETTAASGRTARNSSMSREGDLGIWDQTEEEKRKARKEARAMNDGRPEFHGGRAFGKLISAIGTILLIVAILACLGLTVPRFAGIEQYVVISGSMEPAIPVGSMVYSAQTDPSTLEAGDIIVFHSDETGSTPVTHRVVENHVADGEIITKGDANAQNDANPVAYADVLGKLVLHVPMLGYIAAPIATVMGKVAMGCVILAAYLLTVVGGRLSGK